MTMTTLRAGMAALLFLALPAATNAATITLTNSDALGATSFNAALNWANGQAPTATNAYVVTNNFTLRTPAAVGNQTFLGGSLALGDGTTGGLLTYKGTGTADVITVTNMLMNLGTVGNGQAGTFTLAGETTIGAGGATFDYGASGRGITISAALKGAGGFKTANLGAGGAGTVTLTGTNTFNGVATVATGVLTLANSSALLNGSVVVSNNAKLRLTGSITITGRTATITGTSHDFFGALNSLSGTNTWTGPVTLGADQTRIGANSNATLIVSGPIDAGASIWGPMIRAEDTSATVILSGISTYSGRTLAAVGRLKLGTGDNRLPVGTVLEVGNASNAGGAIVDLAGFNQQLAGLTDLGTTMSRLVTNSSLTLSTLTVAPTGTAVYAGVIGGGVALIMNGPGTQTLSGTNTYTGGTVVNGGTLTLAGGPGSSGRIRGTATIQTNGTMLLTTGDVFGYLNAASALTNLIINGGTLTKNVTGNETMSGLALTLNGGTVSASNGGYYDFFQNGYGNTSLTTLSQTNTATFSARLNLRQSASTITVAPGTTPSGVDLLISGPITEGIVGAGITKAGAGKLTLGGTNTYTGVTAVNNGTLVLGTGASIGNSTSIRVAAGATLDVTANTSISLAANQTLQGEGTVVGDVSVSPGSRILAGGDGTPGTLTITGTVAASDAAYTNVFDLTNSLAIGSGVNDLLEIDGSIVPAGSSLRIRPLTTLSNGTYRLINYSGLMITDFAPVPLGNTYRDSWTLDTNTSGQVNLIVAAGTNQSLVWSPQLSADWDLLTSANWTNTAAGILDVYADNDSVLFDDTGAISNVVTLATQVKPAALVVNSSSNYTFTGAGRISDSYGPLTLLKDGAGTLTLGTTNNDYSGGTLVSNGTVVIGASSALGTGPIALSSGTTLEDAAGGTIPGAISGGGQLVKSGGSTLTLSGTNTYSGTTTISNGAVVVSGSGSLGSGTYAADIANDGALTLGGATQLLSGAISGTGSLTQAGANTLTLGGSAANTYSGLTTLAGPGGQLGLAKTGGAVAVAGNITLASAGGTRVILYGTQDNQFGPGSVMTFLKPSTTEGRFELLGTTQTLAGVVDATGSGFIQQREFAGPAQVDGLSTLILDGSGNYSYNGALRNMGGPIEVIKNGSGTQALVNAAITYTGATTIANGTLTLRDTTAFVSPVGVGPSGTLEVVRTALGFGNRSTLAGNAITGSGIINVNNSGTGLTGGWVRVNSASAMNFTGVINVNSGVFGTDSAAGAGVIAGSATVNVGTAGVFTVHSSAGVTIGGLNGWGDVTPAQSGGGTYNLTLGAADKSGSYAGTIHGNNSSGVTDGTMEAGFLSLTKIGAGTQTLGGTNTYTGITTVNGGTLALAAGGSITGTPRILVATGATFDVSAVGTMPMAAFQSLEGYGFITGGVVAAAGSRIIPGATGSVATLTFDDVLSLNAAATNYFDLRSDNTPGSGINDLVDVGGLLEPSNAVIAINPLLPLTNGSYRLFNYTGTKSTTFNTNVLGNVTRPTWTLDETTPGQVNLLVGGSYGNLRWNPITSTNWDYVGTNWYDMTANTTNTFMPLDHVLFDDNGAYLPNVNLATSVAPQSITVNSASNYSIGGPGKITGLTGVTKDGSGILTLGGTGNDYTGPVTISGGTISVAADLSLGAVPAAYSPAQIALHGGTLRLTAAMTIPANRGIALGAAGGTLDTALSAVNNQEFFNSIISGIGPLTLNANGNLSDTGGGSGGYTHLGLTNTFSGAVAINSGVVSFAGDASFGNPTNVITLNGGGLLAFVNRTLDRNIALAGGGDRIFRTYGNMLFTVNSPISGNGNIRRTDGGTNIFNGNLTYTGSFINAAAAVTWLLGTNTYTDGTILTNASTLIIRELSDSGPSGIANSGLLTFSGGTLRYDGAAATATMRSITNIALYRTIFNVTNSAASVLLGGTIGGTGGLTKLGDGILVISNNQVTTFQANPGIEIQRGTLLLADGQINSQNPANFNDYIGRNNGNDAVMTLAGFSAYNRSNAVLYIGDGTGAKGVLNIQDDATFYGNYQVRLGQNTGATGIINQTGGSLTVASSDLVVGNSGLGLYHHLGGRITNGGVLYIGLNGGARGAFYQIDGTLVSPGTVEFRLGNNFGAYGYFGMSGGSMTRGNWSRISESGLGVYHQSGGTNTATGSGYILATAGGTGIVYMTGGLLNPSNLPIIMGYNNSPGGGRSEMTVAENATVLIGNNVLQMNRATQTNKSINVLNLNGGEIIANSINKGATGGYSIANFNGGLLSAYSTSNLVYGLDAAYVYGGGAFINTSNNLTTLSQALLAPTGNGVSSIALTGTITGYIGAPQVVLSGGGGSNATAVALFDYLSGSVTGLVVTGAGQGYTSAPTVTLSGGGKANDSSSAVATIGANSVGGLTKLGNGLLLLNGANTYTGETIVSAGYLYGTGSVAGAVIVSSGSGIGPSLLSPVAGTFTIASSLTISNGGSLAAYLRGTNPTLRVNGDFNVSPTCNVQLIALAALTTGTQVLVDYAGAFNGNIADFTTVGLPAGSYLTNNTVNGSIDLVITNVSSGIRWDGLVDATWKNAGPLNWKNLLDDTPAIYSALDTVLFDDEASANFTVDVTEAVSPSAVTVSNTNKDFTIGGVGAISSSGSLTKDGPGALTLSSANTFAGGTVLKAGTLKLGNPGALGAAASVIRLNGGVLQLANDATVNAYSNAIGGSVTILLDRATSGAGITNTLGGFAFTNTATLTALAGTNVTSGISTLIFNGFPQLGPTGVTATFEVGTNAAVALTGSLNGVNSSALLVKTGEGTLILSGDNSWWDAGNGVPVTLGQGTLDLRNARALGDGAGTTHVYPLIASAGTTLRLTADANTTFLGFGTNVINGDNATVLVDRVTPGAAVTHTLTLLAIRSNFTFNAVAGGNITNGNAGVNYNSTTLGGDAVINVVNPMAGGGTMGMTLSGLITQSGAGRSLTKIGNGTLTLAPNNPATYSGGTVVNGGTLVLGFSNGSSNYGTIAGTLLINTGATVRCTVDKALGFANAASGNVTTVTINGGLLEGTSSGGMNGGQTVYMTAGEIRSNGGTNSTTSGSFRFAAQGTDPAIYVLASSATSIISGRVTLDTTGKFDVQDGAAAVDLFVAASLTDGVSGAPNGIVKTNAGVMALTSPNTYNGTTAINGGTLLINGSTATGAVSVAAGATLGGTGSVGGTVTSSGTVAPGTSAGVLSLTQNYSQTASGVLAIEIGGTAVGSGHDLLAVGGTASLDGALNVSLINTFVPTVGNAFTVLTASVVSGNFATTNLPALGGGDAWTVTYAAGAVILSVTNIGGPTGYDLAATVITNGLTGYQQDADGDGYANLLEYATGGSLTNAGVEARMQGVRTNGVLALQFTRNTNAVDATIIVEGSYSAVDAAIWLGIATNIGGSWGAGTNVVTSGTNSPVNETAYDTDTTATNRFLRLRVTRP